MQPGLRLFLAGALAALLLLAQGAARAADPSVQEMIDALAPKPSASTQGVGVVTRSLRRSASPAPPTREGRLQLSVQFEYASAAISPRSRELLTRLAEAMKAPALAQLRYRIEGHTDITGSAVRNQSLSERRAQSVAEFLKGASGVGAARLNTIGLGSSTPANPNDLKAAENRRVVIVSVEAAPESSATTDDGAGTVQRVQGALYVRREGVTKNTLSGARVREGDVLSTPANAAALVRFDDGANVLLRSDTTVEFRKLRLAGEAGRMGQVMELLVGALRFVSGSFGRSRPESVAFVTQTATLGLRGTDFDLVYAGQYSAEDPGTYVKVNEGGVAMGGVDGSTVELGRDEQAFAGNPKVLTRSLRTGPATVKLAAPSKVFSTGELDGLLAGK